jgi:hypothetical protein
MRYFILLSLLVLATALVLACVSPPPVLPTPTPTLSPTPTVPSDTTLTAALTRFTTEVNASLQELDSALAKAAQDLGRTGITGAEANETLALLANSSPYAVDAVAISPEGFIAAAMPEQYWSAVGAYVGNESHNERALRERVPLMSPVFRAEEGFDAASLRYPVWNATGGFLGLATVLVNPQRMLAAQADEALAGTPFTAWAMQTDGYLIYDRDPGELVGHNLITDPVFAEYPDLVALASRMARERSGTGTYTFTPTGGGSPVHKEAVWDTVSLHGTEWRLLLAREV